MMHEYVLRLDSHWLIVAASIYAARLSSRLTAISSLAAAAAAAAAAASALIAATPRRVIKFAHNLRAHNSAMTHVEPFKATTVTVDHATSATERHGHAAAAGRAVWSNALSDWSKDRLSVGVLAGGARDWMQSDTHCRALTAPSLFCHSSSSSGGGGGYRRAWKDHRHQRTCL